MPRRSLTWLLLLALVSFALPITLARAGGQRWSAWMFNDADGQLLLLTDVMAGSAQSLTLPMQAGYDKYARNVAISHNWRYIAYALLNSSTGAQQFVVYDREAGGVVRQFGVPQMACVDPDTFGLGFVAHEYQFSEDNTAVAFGYCQQPVGWEIRVIRLTDPDSAGSDLVLRADNPAVKALVELDKAGRHIAPTVWRYRDGEVTFIAVPLGTEGLDRYPNYTWNTSTNTVRITDAYLTMDTDIYVPTGESISDLVDDRFPSCGEPCGPYWTPNTLSVYDPATGTRFPFYTTSQYAMFRPTFIQGGERILVGLIVQGSMESGAPPRWAVLERNGALVGYLPDGISIESVIGWQDGFLYMPPVVNPSGSPTLFVVNTRSGLNGGSAVWTGTPGTQVRLMQTPGNMQIAGPFMPWQKLTGSAAGPTAAPPGTGGVLAVGGQATVNTTGGDMLRMRSGPGTSFAVISLLSKGTLVTILEGPRSADGLMWWRVRTPDGKEGWVIESITDQGTVIQTLIPS
jgi:hypothetical protein